MYLAMLIMKLSCHDFKIRKFVEENHKTLCLNVCVYFFFFFGCQYMKFSFYQILYNLSFLITILKKIPGAAIEHTLTGPFLIILTIELYIKKKKKKKKKTLLYTIQPSWIHGLQLQTICKSKHGARKLMKRKKKKTFYCLQDITPSLFISAFQVGLEGMMKLILILRHKSFVKYRFRFQDFVSSFVVAGGKTISSSLE